MEQDFDPEYPSTRESSDPGDDGTTNVLFVDGDEPVLSAATRFGAREYDGVTVRGTTDATTAVDVLDSTPWDCLVVGGALDESDRLELVSTASCPIVLFTTAGRRVASDAVLERADAVVEKGTDHYVLEILFDKIRDLASADEPTELDALARDVASESDDCEAGTACFLVDGDGDLVWSSRSFEDAFAVDESSLPDAGFDERLAAVFDTVPDGTDDVLSVAVHDGRAISVDDAHDGIRYVRHERHRLPDDAGGFRLEVFEGVTDRVDTGSRGRLLELLVEQARDGLYVLDENGRIALCNETMASMLGYERDELVGRHVAELFAEGDMKAALRNLRDVIDAGDGGGAVRGTFLTRQGEPVPVSVNYAVLPADEYAMGGFVGVARDVTDGRRREDELAAQRDELAAVTRADELVRAVIGELGDASTRDELERAVCERLLDHEAFRLAWIGQRAGGNDRVVPGTVAGEPQQYLRDVVAATSADDARGGPVLRAVNSREVQIVDDVRDEEMVSQWRDLAVSHDLYSLAMVPLAHGDTVHGVLAIYGDRPNAFGSPMVDRLTLLGDTVGYALTAVRNKRLLERDVTVELEFRSDDDDACLVRIARACDCRLEAAGAVDLGEDVLRYLRVEDSPPGDVADAAHDCDGVADTRVVRQTGAGGGVVELRSATSLRTALSEVGARLRRAVATPSGARIVVETTSDGDVRTVHETVCRSYPGAELVTKTERERSRDDGNDSASATDVLTDRQREVLRAAFLAGYYAWPRDTTAEQLAESLDIASPTLHQHLRRAESKLLDELLDD